LSPTDPAFPELLADAAADARVTETFGVGPSLVALALGTYGASAFAGASTHGLDSTEYGVLALLFAGAAGCLGHEVRRRRIRVVLVAAERQIGVYRQGRLQDVLGRADLMASRAPQFGSIRAIVVLAFLSVAFLWYGAGQEGTPLSRLGDLVPGVALSLLTASFVWTVWLCQAFLLPGSRSRALFSTSGLDRAGVTRAG
jgi:hypothetical protein